MTKELEALDFIQDESKYSNDIKYRDAIDLIRSGLIEKEDIANANPTEALEDLEKLKGYYTGGINSVEVYLEETKEYETIKQTLLKMQAVAAQTAIVLNRSFNKSILYLKECIEKCIDKPILYISRTYGNKYIVPQEQFDNLAEKNVKYKRLIEQLDCPLEVAIVAFKAMSKGIYAKDPLDENKLNYIPTVTLSNLGTEWYLSNHCDFCVNVRDYKELFWLREDKRE